MKFLCGLPGLLCDLLAQGQRLIVIFSNLIFSMKFSNAIRTSIEVLIYFLVRNPLLP